MRMAGALPLNWLPLRFRLHGDDCATQLQTWRSGSDQADNVSVLIIGGFAMKPRHLMKYRKLYREQGIERVETLAPSILTMTVPRFADRAARQLLTQLQDHDGEIVLHLFSGAVWIYYALNEFAPDAVRSKIRAVVFESTPLDVKPEQFGRFMAWKLGRAYQPIWSRPFVLYRWLVGISPTWEARNRRNMLALPAAQKVLFVYSQSDVIAEPSYIDQYVTALHSSAV